MATLVFSVILVALGIFIWAVVLFRSKSEERYGAAGRKPFYWLLGLGFVGLVIMTVSGGTGWFLVGILMSCFGSCVGIGAHVDTHAG